MPETNTATSFRISATAEIAGIFAGDVSLYKTSTGHVLEIRGGSDEADYTNTVRPLFELSTGVQATATIRHYSGGYCNGIRCCKQEVRVLFHNVLGFPIGDKLQVKVPKLILDDQSLWVDYLRGVYDTDGCVYLTKTGKGNARHPVVNIASSSVRHKREIHFMLRRFGFSCWMLKEGVALGGWSTVDRFFREVKPHNPKHLRRFERFYAGRGSQAWHGDG